LKQPTNNQQQAQESIIFYLKHGAAKDGDLMRELEAEEQKLRELLTAAGFTFLPIETETP
jgi:hypothetical protein